MTITIGDIEEIERLSGHSIYDIATSVAASAVARRHIYHPENMDALLEAIKEFDNEDLNVWLVMKLGEVIEPHLRKE